MKVTLNKIAGEIIEHRQSLPDVGFGPSTVSAGREFIPDTLPALSGELRFEFDGRGTINGKKLKHYKVFRRCDGAFQYERTFRVPAQTPKKHLEMLYAEWVEFDGEQL